MSLTDERRLAATIRRLAEQGDRAQAKRAKSATEVTGPRKGSDLARLRKYREKYPGPFEYTEPWSGKVVTHDFTDIFDAAEQLKYTPAGRMKDWFSRHEWEKVLGALHAKHHNWVRKFGEDFLRHAHDAIARGR